MITKIEREKEESISCAKDNSDLKHNEMLAELEALHAAKSMLDFELVEAQTALEEKDAKLQKYTDNALESTGKNYIQ